MKYSTRAAILCGVGLGVGVPAAFAIGDTVSDTRDFNGGVMQAVEADGFAVGGNLEANYGNPHATSDLVLGACVIKHVGIDLQLHQGQAQDATNYSFNTASIRGASTLDSRIVDGTNATDVRSQLSSFNC